MMPRRALPWVAAALILGGCVERTLLIQSEPAGARAFVNGRSVGTTPVEVPFTWYGKHEIVLEQEGYQTHRAVESVDPPWWQYPVVDLVTDLLIPATLTDRRSLTYPLAPTNPVGDPRPIEQNAEPLRRRLQQP